VRCSYQANFAVLKADMAELGFHLYVPEGPAQGCIISTFLWPDDPAFNFDGEAPCLCRVVAAGKVITPPSMPPVLLFRDPLPPTFSHRAVFYRELAKRGCVIYPGKLTKDNCFRIGSIGRLYPRDMRLLTTAIREVLQGMGVALPLRQIEAVA
jgi:2-aminoethylphosphonate-pyruvate transaminase